MQLNKKSNFLVVLIATYNRLNLLKKSIDSVISGTKVDNEIIVIDGGSTDGTIQYLKSRKDITPVFQNKLFGTSRAYNRVWKKINCKYTCWLSDDTILIKGSLDSAVKILQQNSIIGMVGLKMKDVVGEYKKRLYLGSLSIYKILNCNHGVLSYQLLKNIGFFNENYRSYTIDPDLTASVLCAGKKVVMTKKISIYHYREWILTGNREERMKKEMGEINNQQIYNKKFRFLKREDFFYTMKSRYIYKIMLSIFKFLRYKKLFGANKKDWQNILLGRFIGITDFYINRKLPYHLVQKISHSVLVNKNNPYKHLLSLLWER